MKKNKKKISIVGLGKVGKAVLERLYKLGYEIDFIALGNQKNKIVKTSYGSEISVVNSDDYKVVITDEEYSADYIVVCTSGEVLEKNIDMLLLAKKPLIILSTKYDEKLIREKCIKANVPAVLSPNMALPILDFWKRLEKLGKTYLVQIVEATESHPGFKKDVSGSLVNTLEICSLLGIKSDFNILQAKSVYKVDKNAKSGCVTWIRSKETQKQQYQDFIEEEYLDAHAYHKYVFEGNHTPAAKQYLYNMFSDLESLEDYSNELLNFSIYLSEDTNTLIVIQNINGRSIYGDGVEKAIMFLENNNGVYSGVDILE